MTYPTWELRPGGGWQSAEQRDGEPDVAIWRHNGGPGWVLSWRTSGRTEWFATVAEAKDAVARGFAR